MADKDRRDDSLFPDTKYHGLLFEAKPKRYDEDDIAVLSRRETKPRKSASAGRRRKAPLFRIPFAGKTFKSKGKPTAVTRLSSGIAIKDDGIKVIRPQKPLLKDRFVRNTLIACVIAVGASLIAIPTSFAKPTTDIRINDSGRVLEASTAALTVGEFLEDNKITIGPDDILETDPSSPIVPDMEIIIRRGMPVTVYSGRNSITVNMVAGTVRDALVKGGIVPSPIDEVYPSYDTYIRSGMKIDHVVVQTGERLEHRDISFKETEREDPDLDKGKTKIVQEGQPGELEITYKQIYKNGVVTSEELLSETVTKEPVDQITAVGSYVEPPPKKKTVKMSDIKKSHTTSSSSSSSSSKTTTTPKEVDENGDYKVEVEITAYCSACNTGSKTASGAYPTYGTVAASLRQFKMGTKLFIPGYGYGVVQDTGSFPPGTIDVYMGEREVCTCVQEWGSKYAKITVFQ